MLADTVFLIKDNNVIRCGEKYTDKADASHHFILLQSHSKTERVVQSAEFLLSLRSPRRKRGGPLCRLICFRSLTEDRTGGKERKGKESKDLMHCTVKWVHLQLPLYKAVHTDRTY